MSFKRLSGGNRPPPRDYKDDVFKSLDAVISDRGIARPGGGGSSRNENRRGRFGGNGGGSEGGGETEFGWKRKREQGPGGGGGSARRFEMRPRSEANLDPFANSLEDVIEDRGVWHGGKPKAPGEDEVDNRRKFRRGDAESFQRKLVTYEEPEEEFGVTIEDSAKEEEKHVVPTSDRKSLGPPSTVVQHFVDKGMDIEIKVGKRVPRGELKDVVRKWRCVVTCGEMKGIAEAARKEVAKEVACDCFIKNLKDILPFGEVPYYLLPDFTLGGYPKSKVYVDKECDMRALYNFATKEVEDDKDLTLLEKPVARRSPEKTDPVISHDPRLQRTVSNIAGGGEQEEEGGGAPATGKWLGLVRTVKNE